MQKSTDNVAACLHLKVIYFLLYLHDFIMILSTERTNRFIQIPELIQLLQNFNSNQSSTADSNKCVFSYLVSIVTHLNCAAKLLQTS